MDKTAHARSFWVRAGFIFYAVFCLILFVYLRFPYDTLKGRIESTLGSVLGAEVSLGHLSSSLPLGLAADGLDINAVPVATKLLFHPRLSAIFSGRLGLDVRAVLDTGDARARIGTPILSIGDPVEAVFDIEDMDPAPLARLVAAGRQVKGLISGQATLSGSPGSLQKAQAKVSFVWKDGSIPLSVPAIPVDALAFKTLEVAASMDKGMLTIEQAELSGDISGTVKGSVRVQDNVERSRLNLTGELQLPQELKTLFGMANGSGSQGVKFSLRGTVDNPRFRVLSR